jgi:photosystem II stability/assembly factor-like uncharacterized protein
MRRAWVPAVVVLCLSACAPPAPSPSPSAHPSASPAPTLIPTPTVAPGVLNVRMFNAAVGWAQRQSDGAILHTTNGISQWNVAAPNLGTDQILAVAFVDADAARLLAAPAAAANNFETPAAITSWASDDGGASWSKGGSLTGLVLLNEQPGSLDFVDRKDGWYSITGLAAAGSSAIFIYRTSDGGAQWSEVDASDFSSPGRPGKIPTGCDKNPASFINATTGWVTAQCNGGPTFFYVTHNAGVNWSDQALPIPKSIYGTQTAPPQFTSSNEGFMLADAGAPGANWLLYVTTDGGRTWNLRATPVANPPASYFLGAENGWIAGSPNSTLAPESALWVTSSAGRTWASVTPNLSLQGLSLEFVTPQLGWAFAPFAIPFAQSSPPSQLLQTTDGGRTWAVLNPVISQT